MIEFRKLSDEEIDKDKSKYIDEILDNDESRNIKIQRLIIEIAGISLEDFADEIGYSSEGVRNFTTTNRPLSRNFEDCLIDYFEMNDSQAMKLHWLSTNIE